MQQLMNLFFLGLGFKSPKFWKETSRVGGNKALLEDHLHKGLFHVEDGILSTLVILGFLEGSK